jgi:hypothetical protein
MKMPPSIAYYVASMLILGFGLLWYVEFSSPVAEWICGLIGVSIALAVFSAYMSAKSRQ